MSVKKINNLCRFLPSFSLLITRVALFGQEKIGLPEKQNK